MNEEKRYGPLGILANVSDGDPGHFGPYLEELEDNKEIKPLGTLKDTTVLLTVSIILTKF